MPRRPRRPQRADAAHAPPTLDELFIWQTWTDVDLVERFGSEETVRERERRLRETRQIRGPWRSWLQAGIDREEFLDLPDNSPEDAWPPQKPHRTG